MSSASGWLRAFLFLCALGAAWAGTFPARAAGPLVLVAASFQEAAQDAADAFAERGHERPVISAAGTSALARQVAAGAPADLFISADREWMSWLAKRGRVDAEDVRLLAHNRLVIVSRDRRPWISSGEDLLAALGNGRLAIAEPESVPAGRYARAALERLGAWQALYGRLAPAENVRAALALVERGAAPLGIVYQTDARLSERVHVAGRFSERAHPQIVYPAALLSDTKHPEAQAFLDFLESDAAQRIFARHGFAR